MTSGDSPARINCVASYQHSPSSQYSQNEELQESGSQPASRKLLTPTRSLRSTPGTFSPILASLSSDKSIGRYTPASDGPSCMAVDEQEPQPTEQEAPSQKQDSGVPRNPGFPQAQSKVEFLKKFRLSKLLLGEGSFSTVRLGLCLTTFQSVAVKIIDKSLLSKTNLLHCRTELMVLKYLSLHKHPNIVELLDYYEDSTTLVLVFPHYDCDLYELLDNKELTDEEIRPIFSQIVEGLRFLHKHRIAHCDIKAENVLVNVKTGRVALTDFGFADFVFTKNSLSRFCGSVGYVAPEILASRQYGCAVDIWSLGVLLFVLICRRLPFYDPDEQVEFKRMLKADYKFRSREKVSKDARSFLKLALRPDADKRPPIEELVGHKFLRFR